MNWLENISLTFSYPAIFFVLGVLLIFAYTIFIYRTTLPQISSFRKALLIFLRSLILITILLLIFDPILKISDEKKVEPITNIYIDNSKSIAQFGNKEEIEKLNSILSNVNDLLPKNTEIFKFGNKVKKINIPSDSLDFSESSTSFADVVEHISKTNNISSAMIISDGIYNSGFSPEQKIKEFGIPIYTIGIGDTSIFKDISVEQISSNKFIYANRETDIEVLIKSSGYKNQQATVQLLENEKILESKKIDISNTEINRVKFNYKTSDEGKHILTARIFTNTKEKNSANNYRTTVVNVLATKKKILVIAGNPSRDLSIILSSLQQSDDYEIEKIIEIGKDKFYKNNDNIANIDKADIIFFVGFPNKNTTQNYIEKIASKISENKIPFFFAFSNSFDLNKIKYLSKLLPFNIGSIKKNIFNSQVLQNRSINNILGNTVTQEQAWADMPPINILGTEIIPSKNSTILLREKVTQKPILFTNTTPNNKSIILVASNIWKWKLQAPNKELKLFDNFIFNSIKWLTIENNQNGFSVTTNKKNYKLGEKIIFQANLYNETLEPISDAKIMLKLNSNQETENTYFTSKGNGIYEAEIIPKNSGQLNYTASLENYQNKLKSAKGTINIESIEIELVDRTKNKQLLLSIASNTNGFYNNIDQIEKSFVKMNNEYDSKIYFKTTDKELRLSNFEFILIIIILLFSIEWIFRKWLRML